MPIQITESVSSFEKKVLYAFRDELNKQLPPLRDRIEISIKNRSDQFFLQTKEAQALLRGILRQHFGIPAGEEDVRVHSIVRTICNNIEVSFKKFSVVGKTLRGGFSVGVLVNDFSDVLANPESIVTTDKGQDLPWLKWLLLEGDKIIIVDYDISFGRYSQSRAGGAIMKKSKIGFWRVPPEYSGTVRNNWLTRAILDASSAYIDMVGAVMEKELQKVF